MPNQYGAAVDSGTIAGTGGLPTGIGDPGQATQATAWMRQQPWYMAWLQSKGITPGQGDQVKLSDDQRDELKGLLVQHGVGLNNKYDEIDENGQISEGHHKLKKTLIGAAIGGAALTGLGAAGIGPLTGLFGASAAPLASTQVGSGFIPAITGGTGLAAEGGALAAGVAPAAVAGGVGAGGALTAAGTAAAVAPKVADVASKAGGVGSWLTSPAGSLLTAGIAEGGNIFAGIKQAGAEKEAAALQDKQFQQALDAQKEQEQYGRNNYAAYLQRLQGYADTGNASNGRLASFMGQGAAPTNTQGPPLHPSATPPPQLPPSSPGGPMAAPFQPPPQGAPMGQQPQGQTVKMVGPDGSFRDIPADQVPKFTAMGAKLAQAGA